MSHAAIGRKGRKNWRVMGRTRERSKNDATAVLTSAPGDSMMQSENMPRIARRRYWPSYSVHRWHCRERNVSAGEKEVWRAVIEEAGDWRLRSLERSFRRIRCGTKSLIVRHGKEMLDFEKTLGGCSFHSSIGLSIALAVSHETAAAQTRGKPP